VATWLNHRRRVVGFGLGAMGALSIWAVTTAFAPPAAGVPAEPAASKDVVVPFDHTIHAGQYEMPCLSCHLYADRAPNAGLPSARKCMGCHKFAGKDKPGVQALAALFEQGQAPRWPRVTHVPDFIYFTHRMHVRKEVACEECHGDVKKMRVVSPARKLTMGFCVDCHNKRSATVECVACHK
jgi:hypothetical protein